MQPRNNEPEHFMMWVALVITIIGVCMIMAGSASGQVLRPSSECTTAELYYCEIFHLDPCPCEGAEISRVAPFGAPIDPWAGSYMLPKTIGVIQIAYEPEPVRRPVSAHMTSYELLDEVAPEGFGSLKIWMDAIPFEGMGEWCWETYWGKELCGNYNHEALEMERFWTSIPDGMVVFLRPESPAWTWYQENPCIDGDGDGPALALADYYSIATRLFETIGDHNIQVVLTDWEQDWQSCQEENGGLEFTLRLVEQRQDGVERARKEAYIRAGHRPKLQVFHAIIVNKYPNNAPDWAWPYLTEMIPTLEHRPDFIGLSYWLKGSDPIETLQWISDTTGYPPHRIYIDELGSNESSQAQRFSDYIPAIWEWGVRTINIWLWRQTWCAVPVTANKGLWKQLQPCDGKVVFGEPTDGLEVLRRMVR